MSQLLSVCVPSGWLRMGATQQHTRLSGLSCVAHFRIATERLLTVTLCNRKVYYSALLRQVACRNLKDRCLTDGFSPSGRNAVAWFPGQVGNMLNRKALVRREGIEPPVHPPHMRNTARRPLAAS